jgi:hypothetical protein
MELVRMYEDGDGRKWVLYGNIVVDAEVWEPSQGDRLDAMVIVCSLPLLLLARSSASLLRLLHRVCPSSDHLLGRTKLSKQQKKDRIDHDNEDHDDAKYTVHSIQGGVSSRQFYRKAIASPPLP